MKSIWDELGIAWTRDERDIKRAYARRLKEVHPEDDPQGFQALREAYETALRGASGGRDANTAWMRASRPSAPRPLPPPAPPEPLAPPTAVDRNDGTEADSTSAQEPSASRPSRRSREALAGHEALKDRLAELVRDPDGGDGARLEALEALLSSPTLEAIKTYRETQTWLARLIRENPAAEILLEPAARHFGWTVERYERPASPDSRRDAGPDVLRALKNRLAELVRDPDAPEGDLIEALERLLSSPGMQTIKTHRETEAWLVRLIRENPDAEPLTARAARHFGWDAQRPTDPTSTSQGQEEAKHRRLVQVLGQAVHAPNADPSAVMDALLAVLRSPGMDLLKVHAETEYWLARVIAEGPSAADTLVEPSIHYFRWDANRLGPEANWISPVLVRRDAIAAVTRLHTSPGYAPGFKALSRPATWRDRLAALIDPGLETAVQEVLDLDAQHGGRILPTLNPERVQWWRRRLSGARFGPTSVWAILIVGLFAGLVAVGSGQYGPADAAIFFAAACLAGGGLLLVLLARIWLIARPREWWMRKRVWTAPPWQRLGWAPAAVALWLLISVAPGFTWLGWMATACALVVFFWANIAGEPDPRHGMKSADRIRIGLFGLIVPAAIWLFQGPLALVSRFDEADGALAMGIAVGMAFLALLRAEAMGMRTLQGVWNGVPQVRRRQMLAGLGALIGLAIAVTVISGSGALAGLSVALVLLAVLGERMVARVMARINPSGRRIWFWGAVWLVGAVMGGVLSEAAPEGDPNAFRVGYALAALIAVSVMTAGHLLAEFRPKKARKTDQRRKRPLA